jgi:hypothetical protein
MSCASTVEDDKEEEEKKKNLRIKHGVNAKLVNADMSTGREKVRLLEDGDIVSQNRQEETEGENSRGPHHFGFF